MMKRIAEDSEATGGKHCRAPRAATQDGRERAGGTYLLVAPLLVSVQPGAALGLLVLVLLVAGALWWWRRKAGSRGGRPAGSFQGDPPLIFPLLPSDPPEVLRAGRAARPAPSRRRRPAMPQVAAERVAPEPLPPAPAPVEDTPVEETPREVTARGTRAAPKRRKPAEKASAGNAPPEQPSRPARRPRRAPVEAPREIPAATPAEPLRPAAVLSPAARAVTPVPVAAEEGELFDGNTVRYYRPIEGTMQFLPGRLEIVDGEDRGQDIRFVRIWGATPEVTFGRTAGPPHRHVQLRARTVSREHARMSFEQERWRIHNLSQTNPIVVNGQELHSADAAQTLEDGDLIEMGEVVFRFRER